MPRIEKVVTENFKGEGFREYRVYPRQIVQGPHGSGKTLLREAICFALHQWIPGTGKRNDDLAQYFSPEGGAVQLFLEGGAWLRRQLIRLPEKKQITIRADTGPYDPELFDSSEVVLNLGELIGEAATIKSPEKKREWILRLLGGGEAKPGEVYELLDRAYAHELNPMATVEHLTSRVDELPEEVRPAARFWESARTVLVSYSRRGLSLSELLLTLSKCAKEQKREAQTTLRVAKNAALEGPDIPEPEGMLRGAEGRLDAAVEKLQQMRALERKWLEATERYEEASRADVEARDDLKRAACEPPPSPGPEPTAPSGPWHSDLEKECQRLQEVLGTCQDRHARLLKIEARVKLAKARLKELEANPTARLVIAANRFAAYFEPGTFSAEKRAAWSEMMSCISKLGKDILIRRLEEEKFLLEHEPHLRQLGKVESDADEAEGAFEAAAEALRQAREKEAEEHREYARALKAWEESRQAETRHQVELEGLKRRAEDYRRRVSDAAAYVEDLRAQIPEGRDPGSPSYAEPEEEAHDAAKQALRVAQELYQGAQAKRKAQRAREAAEIAREAWAAAERAIATLREDLVAGSAEPLIRVANEVLERSGRPERLYLSLENERGRPAWEFGWLRDGRRLALDALSGAETVLASTALSAAIAKFSSGIRCLMIEAAEIHGGLESLLRLLSAVPEEVENVVVLTALPDFECPEGWIRTELEACYA